MRADDLRFETDHPGVDASALRVLGVTGRYRLSAPYGLEIELGVAVEGGLSAEDVDQLLVQPCRLQLVGAEGEPVVTHGVLRRIELLPMRETEHARYRVWLVPKLWRTTLAYGSRIFQNEDDLVAGLTWPEIVSKVLTEHGVPHELRLDGTYPAREYTVQYEESDFAFLSRLLEHWGIFYFFEQTESGEVMVLGDHPSAFTPHADYPTLPYSAVSWSVGQGDAAYVGDLSRVHEVRPRGVDLRDYNWRHPTVTPEGEAPADEASGHGIVYAYGDHIKDPTEGGQLATVRAEQLMATREVYRGRMSVEAIRPGHRFQLDGHPSPDLDLEYVVTETEESTKRGEDGGDFAKHFVAIPASVPFRPQRETPRPRVPGTAHAIVDGEIDGTAAPIDDLGRYKLRFAFDRNELDGGKASRWVRMAQPSTGANYGIHFPLHIGCEVAVQYLGGDPDRPVIVGALPNAETVSPVTQADATKSRIRTRSGILVELEDDGP